MSENKNKEALQQETRNAWQKLLIVLAIAIGVLIYSYGWAVTEIDLAEPQEEQRQTNVTRALRELLSPRIFEQDRERTEFDAPFLMDCSTGDAPVSADANSSETVVIIEPTCSAANEIITVQVINGVPGADARIRWVPPADEDGEARERPLEIIETEREDLVLDGNGGFTGTIEVPRIRGGDGEIHTLRVLVAIPSGPIQLSETANLVIDRMIQTIFMALVATTVAIPIAAVISFFAAQNLMRRLRLSVGSMLMAFIMFSVGVWLGVSLLKVIGQWGLTVGRGDVFAPVGALMAFLIPTIVIVAAVFLLARIAATNAPDKRGSQGNSLLQAASSVITALVFIFSIGALGGLGLLGGEQIMNFGDSFRPDDVSNIGTLLNSALATGVWSVGNLLMILGTLIELFIPVIAGVITGFAMAGLASTLLGTTLRRLRGTISHVLAAIMGAISGAILLAFLSSFALWAALLGILPPLIAGIIGGGILLQLLKRFVFPKKGHVQIKTRLQQLVETIVFIVGMVAVFVFMFNWLNIGRSLVDGTLPPQVPAMLFGIELPMTVYMYNAALIGAILGAIGGGLAGLHGVFPLGNMLYTTSRTSLNVIRSIEPLIMGLVFVIWVGIGPFAGVLALTLHSIAALGKLYSEQIENIDPGPIEALESTGANQLQTILYAVVPQIIPPYIAFTMYRWDINVRMSTIIGFVGGGGIGLLLQQQINLLRYRDAGVAVLAIAIVVSVLDYASASIRERLT